MAEQTDPSKGPNGGVAPVRHDMLLAEQVTKHARTSWLGLLGFLAFAGVTLLGVEDKDFFAYGVETELPLIGVSIPTSSFFWTAPILATALYLHLHLYLLKLWKIVSSLPDRIDGEPLGNRLWPWLVTDWALARRGDQGAPLPLRTIQWLLTVGLVWLAGPLVLLGFWWRSMVKHDLLLTSALGLLLVLALYVGGTGWVFAKKRPARVKETDADGRRPERGVVVRIRRAGAALWRLIRVVWIRLTDAVLRWLTRIEWIRRSSAALSRPIPVGWIRGTGAALWWLIRVGWLPPWVKRAVVFVLMALPVLWISVERTWLGTRPLNPREERSLRFEDVWQRVVHAVRIHRAIAGLTNAQLSVKPDDWLDRDIARVDFVRGLPAGTELEGEAKEKFETEWQRRREEYLSHINAPDLKGADLRGAVMHGAFLVRADLSVANLEGARLSFAHLEGADLSRAYLRRAELWEAHLEGADLRFAHLERANLENAHLEGANLWDTHLERANLAHADLEGASLYNAHLEGAFLNDAHLAGADLRDAHLEGAVLAGAHLEGAVLWGADLSTVQHLRQEQLDGAIGDEDTKLPDGLTIPSCWTKYPKLPKGVPRPKWWDDPDFRENALCAEGEEPRRLPAGN